MFDLGNLFIAYSHNIKCVQGKDHAAPLVVNTLRKDNILWACESALDDSVHPQPDDPENIKLLSEIRTDSIAGKWARSLPGVSLHVSRAEGRHHYNLLTS